MRLVPTVALFALVTSAALLVSPARAQGSVEELARRLSTSEDFRVRTQAALALGASRDTQAVRPLCGGLKDDNTTVRAASAAALGRLSFQAGRGCLRERLASESNQDVRSVIQRALDRIGDGGSVGIPPGTRYYIAIGEPTNDTTRAKSALDSVVRRALTQHIKQLSGFAIAPAGETPEQAKALLAKHPGVKAIFVWPKIKASYAGGALKLEMDLSLFTYPGKAFKGSMKRKLTMPDTEQGDTSSEDQLIEMAAERLAPDLEKTAARI